jgi:serine/threonine-protein kinase
VTSNSERTVLNDRYELQQRIGRGGMADVFLARDLLLDRPVAIKVLFPEFAVDPNFVERFRREAQSAANLNHPNIVGVYDWGKYANTYFMAMEYVQGRTLADILKANGHVTAMQAAEIASEVAAALGFAHRGGVVHRDIKPANILIGANGQVKVADFGIARAMNAPTENNLTQAGSVMGTATYFSPEQAQGGQPDPRSDLYSLGIVLYEMVSGRPPFNGENPVSIAYKQVHENPQPLNQLVADVPRPFEAIVAKLLAKKPEVRYQTAEEVRDDLRRFRNGEPVKALVAVMGNTPPPPLQQQRPLVGATAALPRSTGPVPPISGATTAMPRSGMPGQPRPGQRPANKSGMYAVIGALAIIALVVGGIILFNTLSSSAKPSSFAMPNVVGQKLEDGVKTLQEAGLKPNPQTEVNPAVAPGTIGRTDPVAALTVKKGQKVDVFYSAAGTPFPLEDLKGRTLQEAQAALAVRGLIVDPAIQTENNPDVPSGQVTRTDPVAGTSVKQGDTIKIVISAGANQVSMPPVEGLSQANAQSLLTSTTYGLTVKVQQEASDTVLAGNATRTDPASGQLVAKGAAVTLYVSTGPTQVKVPPLVNLTEAQARAKITALGLVPNVTSQSVPFGDPTDGRVVDQKPASPQLVDPGSTVNITVARALAQTPVTVSITGGPFTYDPATARSAIVATNPAGVATKVTYSNGSTTLAGPPTAAGTYTVTVTITDNKYVLSGPNTATLLINKASVTVTVADYPAGPAPTNFIVISPSGVAFTPSYDTSPPTIPSSTAPTTAGNYRVTITLTDTANYTLPGTGVYPFKVTP